MHQNKKEIRDSMLEKRSRLTSDEIQAMSNNIIKHLLPYLHGNVASFIPFKNEVSLLSLEKVKEITIAYSGIQEHQLVFYKNDKDIQLQRHKFGMMEATDGNIVEDFDVVLVPLLAYDMNKYRIGYGGGYYDRFLMNTNALKIGVAFSFQETINQPVDAWDIPLDMIVNENGVIK